MTLRKTYQELMRRVEVTPEMRSRILAQLPQEAPPADRRPLLRPWLPLAACLALVLLLGGRLLFPPAEAPPERPEGPVVGAVSPFTAAASADELEQRTGLRLPESLPLPFIVEAVSYRAVGGETAEATYSGEGQTAILRKSPGTADNSGDYTSYPETLTLSLDGLTAELRGDGTLYFLACWHTEEESLSLRLPQGLEERGWRELLSALRPPV